MNGLMTYAGLTKEEREKLGEFWGFDWGEEDTGLDEYFKFNPAQ